MTKLKSAALVMALILAGCVSHQPKTAPGYFGPTEPMAQVVAGINANNTRIGTLWAHLRSYEVNFVDDKGRSQIVVGDSGTLMFRKPHDFKVTATKPPGITVFNI